MSFLPLQRFASQCPRSQHAALKEGLCGVFLSPSELSSSLGRGGPRARWGLEYFFPDLSFLCRTILRGWCGLKEREVEGLCGGGIFWKVEVEGHAGAYR